MLTINADAHSLMRRMHKPHPTPGLGEQDKRSVIAIELGDVDRGCTERTKKRRNCSSSLPWSYSMRPQRGLGSASSPHCDFHGLAEHASQ